MKANKENLSLFYFLNEIKNKDNNTLDIIEIIDKKNLDYNKL